MKIYVLCAVVFFSYFAIRGLVALPDPGLDGALSRISPVLLIALIIWFRPPDVSRQFGLIVIALVPVAVVLLGLIEKAVLGGFVRIELLAGNPLALTPALIPLGYLNSYLALRATSVQRQVLHYIGLFAVLIAIGTLAGSRSPYAVILGAVVLHLVWIWVFPLVAVHKHRIRHSIIVTTLVVLSVWVALNFGPNSARMSEFAVSAGQVFSSSIRLDIWRGAFLAIVEQPIFGYGPQNRWAGMEGFLAPEVFDYQFTHPHSLFMTYGMSGGVVGIVIGLSYLLIPNAIALTSKQFTAAEKELFFIAPITVFVFGLANNILFEAYLATVTSLTLLGPYYLFTGGRDPSYHW